MIEVNDVEYVFIKTQNKRSDLSNAANRGPGKGSRPDKVVGWIERTVTVFGEYFKWWECEVVDWLLWKKILEANELSKIRFKSILQWRN